MHRLSTFSSVSVPFSAPLSPRLWPVFSPFMPVYSSLVERRNFSDYNMPRAPIKHRKKWGKWMKMESADKNAQKTAKTVKTVRPSKTRKNVDIMGDMAVRTQRALTPYNTFAASKLIKKKSLKNGENGENGVSTNQALSPYTRSAARRSAIKTP